MAIGLLLSVSKFLGGAAKKTKSPNAENTADKGRKGKPGADTKSETASVTPTSPMVGSGGISASLTPPKVSKPTGKVSFSTITNQLDSMVALTSMIDTITQKQTEGQRKSLEIARKSKEKQKKKDREEKSESGSGALGFLGGEDTEAGNKPGILSSLTPILLGVGALALIALVDKLKKSFDGLGDFFGGLASGFKLFGLTIAAIAKDFPKILKSIGSLFSKIKFGDKLAKLGKSIKGVFGKLGKVIIPGFIKKAVDAIKNGLKFPTKLGVNFGTKLGEKAAGFIGKLSNFIAKTIFDARLGLRGASKSVAPAVGKLSNIIAGTIFDARLGLRGAQKTIAPSLGKLSNFVAKRVFDAKLAFKGVQQAGTALKVGLQKVAAPIAKQVGKLGGRLISIGKGALGIMRRVPIIGPLIVGVATYLETGKLDQSLFELTGTLIGGLLGTFIPIPVLGTLMGELVGEYVGELFYILLRGGGTAALGKKLQDDLKGILTAGQAAMNWAGDGFKRMYEGLPKRNILGNKVPKVEWLLNPLNIIDKAKLMSKAFFSRDPMKEGKVEKKDKEKPTEDSDSPQYFDSGDGKYYYMAEDGAIYYVGASEEEAKRNSAAGIHPRDPDQEIDPADGDNLETTRVMGKPQLTSSYGKMRAGGPHGGTDIAADLGAPLVPVTDATIVDYGKLSLTGAKRGDPSGWGNFIVYKDSQGYYHLYGHVLEDGMKTSGSVKKGVPIAKVGSTGRSSGPHLHWEMGTSWSGGTLSGKIDPLSVYRVEDPFTVGGRMSDNSSTREIKKSTKPKREDFGSGRSGGKNYEKALASYKSEMQSQPEISPQSSPSASVSGVESQASYEQTGGGSTVVLTAPQQQSLGGGGSSGGGGVMRMGSGDVLNSYYRAQLLGLLYKQG